MHNAKKSQLITPKDISPASGPPPGSEFGAAYEANKIIGRKVAGGRSTDRRAQLRKAAARVRESMAPEFQQLDTDEIMAFLRG